MSEMKQPTSLRGAVPGAAPGHGRVVPDCPSYPGLAAAFPKRPRLAIRLSLLAWVYSIVASSAPVSATAQQVQFQPGQLLMAGASLLAPGSYSIPCVTDWNGDGRKDLIVGYQPAGKVAVYLNVGSDSAPAFTSFSNLQAGGTDIVHLSSGCGAPAPFACDYDNDGRRDLLVGDGASGYVYFYRNTNTDNAPVLAPGVTLPVGGSPLSVGYRATPCICDWDGDGLADLLCGNGDGLVFYYRNSGTAFAPEYTFGVPLQAGGVNLNLGIRSVPRVWDWDGDGKQDLLGSSNNGVYWCRNTGVEEIPALQSPVSLRVPVVGGGLAFLYTGPRMRIELTDWNDDGVIDLLVGNADGTVSFFEGYWFLIKSITGQPSLQWKSAPYLRYNVLAGASPAEATNAVATDVPSGGRTTSWNGSQAIGLQFFRIQIVP